MMLIILFPWAVLKSGHFVFVFIEQVFMNVIIETKPGNGIGFKQNSFRFYITRFINNIRIITYRIKLFVISFGSLSKDRQ